MRTDVDLRDAVIDELRYERSIPAAAVNVDVDKGYVTLTGTVASPEQRAAAGRAAMRVVGIHGVNSEIAVSLSDSPIIASG
jgi:osmotically-inducible protein OsmY